MIEKLRTLARMQVFDDKIGQFRLLQQELPKQLNEIIQNVDAAMGKMLVVETEKAELQKKLRVLELDIKTHQDQIKKYSTQLSEIKTNKEYKALNSEIAFLKTKVNDIESQILEMMDIEAEINERLTKAKADLEQAEKTKKDKEGDLRRQIDQLETAIEEARNSRNDLARTLPEALIRQYGSLIKHKGNQAVAYNVDGYCGGCGIVIRPQVKIEMQLCKKILTCENCGRILMDRFKD
ncbi:MAG: C4-type zinc ribbon domain-containing protein [Candidatus Cloacimonadaceae bacterium]|nr:C4-type zinc ribbon domain-containing protein [Candidatus Cloacimonadaceae bacterium]